MSSFKDRIIGAAKLDVAIYEEVEGDKDALFQAMGVVVLSSIAAGIGTIGNVGFVGVLTGTLTALVSWFIWAYLTYFIGVKFIPEPQTEADAGQLLRTIGFSSSPGLLRVAGIIPGLSGIISFMASVWMLVAMVVAVRQALDYKSTVRAVIVCVIGWIIQVLIFMLFYAVFGSPSHTL